MKTILIYIGVTILLISCGLETQSDKQTETQNKYLTYQNIIILSDMSSRLRNLPPKDLEQITKIENFFINECVKPGKKIGDRSCISFSTFFEKTAYKIDLDSFKDLAEKQRFINSTGEYISRGLNQEIIKFNNVVKDIYSNRRNGGLDLVSLLMEKISGDEIIKLDTFLTDGSDTTNLKFENHIYIFTDGYLEYLGKEKNSQFHFGSNEIKKVRNYCDANNLEPSKALELEKSIRLPAIKHIRNKSIHLHILETHERDKDLQNQIYINPKGKRDNEILEAVWRNWALESGFKSFEWKKY